VLKYGFAKAKFTENAIYHLILAVLQAQAEKVDALKAPLDLADAVTKEVANVAESAEATVSQDKVVVTAEVVATVRVDKVVDLTVVAVAAQVDQDNKL
jgi:hypothetical protein